MGALGDEFRSAREARGLSLSDVAERLHIRSVYLGAIEDEEWGAIGAPVYIRGFMRTYARFLGLDAEDAVARFAASAGMPAPGEALRSEEGPATRRPAERVAERQGPSLVAIVAVLVAIAVVAYVGYAYLQFRQPPVPVAQASPSPDADAGTSGSVPDDEASPEVAPPPLPAARPKPALARHGVSVRITATSWLQVTVDGKLVVEGIFPAGTAKSFSGKTVDVRVGNAGGVQVAVNGRPIGPLGASGDVVERRFDLSGE